jgi:hypothetical protein
MFHFGCSFCLGQDTPNIQVIDGSADCPRCGENVPLGNGGEANFWLNHWMKAKCNHAYGTRDKKNSLTKSKKQGSLFSFLKPKASNVPPITAAPTPLKDPSPSLSSPTYDIPAQAAALNPSLQVLEELALLLPLHDTTDVSVFDVFRNPSAALLDATSNGDELWEQLNPVMHSAFGYGLDVEGMVTTIESVGGDGVTQFCQFVTYFVKERGVAYGLFEPKVELLKEALKMM